MKHIYTAKFLLSGNAPPLEDGALLVHAGRIAGIGSRKDITRNHPGIDVVDFPDALIVPLLINAHTHLELTDFPFGERRTATIHRHLTLLTGFCD